MRPPARNGGQVMAGHTNAAPHRSVPGHPALLANASSIWDVQLDTVPVASAGGRLSTWSVSQKTSILDFSWTKCCKHMITISSSAGCMEQRARKPCVTKGRIWSCFLSAVALRTLPLQSNLSVCYRPALTPSGEADQGHHHGSFWALISPEIPRENPRSSCKMFLRSAPER